MMNRPIETTIISAKVTRPCGNRLLPRPRLFARLDALQAARITWISGPPGAGKTTLASDYLAARAPAGIWFQLDAGDADLATFFHYLTRAAQQARVRNSRQLPALTPEYLPSLVEFTRRFAEALAGRPGEAPVIVLDNYEHIPAEASLHEVVRELANALPAGSRVIVLSRGGPAPAYARMRLNEQLFVMDARELDLTRDEAICLATQRGCCLGDKADGGRIDQLLSQSAGWLAGFVLLMAESGNAMAQPPKTGTRQILFDYFATELLGRFDAELQHALMAVAMLPIFTLQSAQQISGNPAVGALLADLHSQNCFVVRRDQTEAIERSGESGTAPNLDRHAPALAVSYEYHALFCSFLLDRGAAVIPAAEWRSMQQLAASVLSDGHQPEAAAQCYRAAADWPGLSAHIEREAPGLVSAGRHRTLQRWLANLPASEIASSPWLRYWQATAYLPFEPARARGFFEEAYRGFERQGDAAGIYTTWAGAMETFFFEWRDFTPADHWIAELERLRMRYPHYPSRDVELRTYWAMGTLLHRQPQHPLLPAWAQRASTLLDPSDRGLSVLLGGYLIVWHLWRGETGEAQALIDRIAPWVDAEMTPVVYILWCCAVGLFHSVRGERDACRKAVDAGLALASRAGLHNFDFMLCGQMARCSLVAGEPFECDRWTARMAGAMRSHSHVDGAFYRYLQCNAAAQHGQWALSFEHACNAMTMAREAGVPFLVAHCHVDLARALIGLGEPSGWQNHLDAARTLGHAMGCRVITYLCAEAEAAAALHTGDIALGLDRLRVALAASRAMGGATWKLNGPTLSAALYEQALVAGIEVAHVQAMIRRDGLTPPNPANAVEEWPWPVRLFTLGRFDIVINDRPLRASGKVQRKPIELLQCICAFGGSGIDQERVTDALWPDAEGDAADQALRTTLHRLRKLLGSESAVRIEGRRLSLDPGMVWTDCGAFDHITDHPALHDVRTLQQAMNRYRGVFLPGESQPWAIAFRQRLHVRYLRIAERLGSAYEEFGAWQDALECYLRAIELEPLAEALYRRLMLAYGRLEHRPEALLAYQRCRQTLLSRLGVSPAPETRALYESLGGS